MAEGERDEDAAVRMSGVRYRWPGNNSFEISIGEFALRKCESVLLLGESGSGKSTLLSLVCGIFAPDHGSIEVDGTDLTALRPSRRDRFRAEQIGVIFQMFNLLPNVTPLDNVLLPLRFAPRRRAKLNTAPREAALSILSSLGLPAEFMVAGPASRLSVGQQQRVAVARALIGAPPLIVADEPTSALDVSSQNAFLDMLFQQVSTANSTLLMVSHDERLASRFDRIVRLEDIATISREAGS